MSEIKVISFNIHKGLSLFGVKRTLREIKALIEWSEANIVCLQEVSSRFLPREKENEFATQLEYLASVEWPHHCYQKNAAYSKGHHGNAILSQWPITSVERHDISLTRFEKRGILHAEISFTETEKVHVLCSHFNLLEKHREIQEEKAVDYIKSRIPPNESAIFCGDFNDWRKKISFQGLMKEAFLELKGEYAKSFPSLAPLLRLDRVYYQNLVPISAEVLKKHRLELSSDHLPLEATFQLSD